MRRTVVTAAVAGLVVAGAVWTLGRPAGVETAPADLPPRDGPVDHRYRDFGTVLRRHVVDGRVDYAALRAARAALDAVVVELGQVTRPELDGWTREQQIAYWINAYNAFTLQAIVDHYPIDGGWLSFLRLAPRSSIRQIPGVWTELRWQAAGRPMTLDEIEHETLRADYDEPRIHFAVNCASVSCPPLRLEPYVPASLDRQLTLAARDFLASDQGLRIDGTTIAVSSVLDWYGEDFVAGYAHLADGASAQVRAILGVVA